MIKRNITKIKKKFLEAAWPFKGIVMEINKWSVKVRWVEGMKEKDGTISDWIRKNRVKKILLSPEEEKALKDKFIQEEETPTQTVIKSRKNRKRKKKPKLSSSQKRFREAKKSLENLLN